MKKALFILIMFTTIMCEPVESLHFAIPCMGSCTIATIANCRLNENKSAAIGFFSMLYLTTLKEVYDYSIDGRVDGEDIFFNTAGTIFGTTVFYVIKQKIVRKLYGNK